MAPEVISHRQYNGKADVYSFGILLWELITRQVPYEGLTPIQAAVGVVQENMRPQIPKNVHPRLRQLMQRCWDADPEIRPSFASMLVRLLLCWCVCRTRMLICMLNTHRCDRQDLFQECMRFDDSCLQAFILWRPRPCGGTQQKDVRALIGAINHVVTGFCRGS